LQKSSIKEIIFCCCRVFVECVALDCMLQHTPQYTTTDYLSRTCYSRLQCFWWSIALHSMLQHTPQHTMEWLRLVGSFKLQVSFAEYSLFYRALLRKRRVILRSLQIEATSYKRLLVTNMLQ